MAVNKVVYGSNTLIDLSSDTITADKLAIGYTSHDSSGSSITGTMQTIGGEGVTWAGLTSATWSILSGSEPPRRNVFSLAFCQFEPDIISHVDINKYGSTFTIRSGSTTGNSVYFMLDPDLTYNLSWTSQNCCLVGYSNSWETIIDERSGDGSHVLSNVTNARYCYFMILNSLMSLTGTFRDVVINEV